MRKFVLGPKAFSKCQVNAAWTKSGRWGAPLYISTQSTEVSTGSDFFLIRRTDTNQCMEL